MVIQKPSPENSETLTDLGNKLKLAASKNRELLDEIEKRKNEHVICGYQISLEAKLPEKPTIEAFPATELVQNIVNDWKYEGEPLAKPNDVFNVNIDYTINNLTDLARLNQLLQTVGSKYPDHLSDRPKNRNDLNIFLSNIKILHRAIEEVHNLAYDMPNPISYDGSFSSSIRNALSAYSDIVAENNKNEFMLRTTFSIGIIPENMIPFFDGKKSMSMANSQGPEELPKLADTESMVCGVTLSGHSKAILSLDTYKIQGITYLASASIDRTIKLWNLETSELVATLRGHAKAVFVLKTLEKENKIWLASGSFDRMVKIWNLEDYCLMMTLEGHSESVYDLAFFERNNEDYLASASRDSTIKLWDLSDNFETETLSGHSGHICAITTFKHDDINCLASGSRDKTIKIWDLSNNDLISTLEGHELGVHTLTTFYFKGLLCLASGSNDKTVKLWSLDTKSLITTLSIGSAVSSFTKYCDKDRMSCLVSGDEDGGIKCWNLVKHKLITTFEGDGYPVFALRTFAHKECVYLACGRFSGNIELWRE